ncbi:hypothetical protein GF312_11895 [Candidatus Poribacteria bacterium]|nr:hypothetical protein [Candidatus Poribacteria bacterium]
MNLLAKLSITIMLLGILTLPLTAAIDDGLLLYFNFDSANGDVVADLSGGGHDGTLKADADITANAKNGSGALQIEGGDETMEVETFAELEEYQANTYLFWINFTAPASGGWDQIMAKPAPGSDRSPGLWVTPEGLSIHYRYNPDNLGPWGITKTGNQNGDFFDENTWYHIAGVTADGEVVCYVNGVEVAREAAPAEIAQGAGSDDTGGLHVGNSPAYGGPAAQFIIDDLAVYNRALSADEVAALMTGDPMTAVDASGKIISAWGSIKSQY